MRLSDYGLYQASNDRTWVLTVRNADGDQRVNLARLLAARVVEGALAGRAVGVGILEAVSLELVVSGDEAAVAALAPVLPERVVSNLLRCESVWSNPAVVAMLVGRIPDKPDLPLPDKMWRFPNLIIPSRSWCAVVDAIADTNVRVLIEVFLNGLQTGDKQVLRRCLEWWVAQGSPQGCLPTTELSHAIVRFLRMARRHQCLYCEFLAECGDALRAIAALPRSPS